MRILLTSGPTRQYLDPVRFISNASSGIMGRELAEAAIQRGHEVIVVTGPVKISYPSEAEVIEVETTEQMLEACEREFPFCDGLIGAAAPCDYRPVQVSDHKIRKTGEPVSVTLIETPDIVATLGGKKRSDQWTLGFALETEDAHFRAITKLQKKFCDAVAVNDVSAINSRNNSVEIVIPSGEVSVRCSGSKSDVAEAIIQFIEDTLER